jgi:hypothetical protein
VAYQLLVGFDQETPPEQATAAAIAEWHKAVVRDGGRAASEPVARIVRTEERTAVDEYAVDVTGTRVQDDPPASAAAGGGVARDGDV